MFERRQRGLKRKGSGVEEIVEEGQGEVTATPASVYL